MCAGEGRRRGRRRKYVKCKQWKVMIMKKDIIISAN